MVLDQTTLFIILLVLPAALFWCVILLRLRRGQIYRANELKRAELNRMHRHTLWNAAGCLAMLVVCAFVPSARMYLGLAALVMLLGILPLRTVFIEMGVRYSRNGKPKNAG